MEYTFKPFKHLAHGDGFYYPVDVYIGTTWLGTLIAEPDGFVIKMLDTPKGRENIAKSKENLFKSQNLAAQRLHQAWQIFRNT